jgi:hypothetical protein
MKVGEREPEVNSSPRFAERPVTGKLDKESIGGFPATLGHWRSHEQRHAIGVSCAL